MSARAVKHRGRVNAASLRGSHTRQAFNPERQMSLAHHMARIRGRENIDWFADEGKERALERQKEMYNLYQRVRAYRRRNRKAQWKTIWRQVENPFPSGARLGEAMSRIKKARDE